MDAFTQDRITRKTRFFNFATGESGGGGTTTKPDPKPDDDDWKTKRIKELEGYGEDALRKRVAELESDVRALRLTNKDLKEIAGRPTSEQQAALAELEKYRAFGKVDDLTKTFETAKNDALYRFNVETERTALEAAGIAGIQNKDMFADVVATKGLKLEIKNESGTRTAFVMVEDKAVPVNEFIEQHLGAYKTAFMANTEKTPTRTVPGAEPQADNKPKSLLDQAIETQSKPSGFDPITGQTKGAS